MIRLKAFAGQYMSQDSFPTFPTIPGPMPLSWLPLALLQSSGMRRLWSFYLDTQETVLAKVRILLSCTSSATSPGPQAAQSPSRASIYP